MTDNERSIQISRTAPRSFIATNRHGSTISLGEGQDDDFTPVELLLVAIAGCSAMDVDYITSRRAEPSRFDAVASTTKLADDLGNHLGEVIVDFSIEFPEGPDGDRARAMLERAVAASRDRLCTVSRTVQLPTPVSYRIEGEELAASQVPTGTDGGPAPAESPRIQGEGPGEYESPGPSVDSV